MRNTISMRDGGGQPISPNYADGLPPWVSEDLEEQLRETKRREIFRPKTEA